MIIPKRWGYEEIIVNTDLYCFKKLYLDKNACTSWHHHDIKDETMIVKLGNFLIKTKDIFGKEHEYDLFPDDIIRIRPGVIHKICGKVLTNMLIEISTHDDPRDSIRDEKIEAPSSNG